MQQLNTVYILQQIISCHQPSILELNSNTHKTGCKYGRWTGTQGNIIHMNRRTVLEMRTFQTNTWICIFRQIIKLEVGQN